MLNSMYTIYSKHQYHRKIGLLFTDLTRTGFNLKVQPSPKNFQPLLENHIAGENGRLTTSIDYFLWHSEESLSLMLALPLQVLPFKRFGENLTRQPLI